MKIWSVAQPQSSDAIYNLGDIINIFNNAIIENANIQAQRAVIGRLNSASKKHNSRYKNVQWLKNLIIPWILSKIFQWTLFEKYDSIPLPKIAEEPKKFVEAPPSTGDTEPDELFPDLPLREQPAQSPFPKSFFDGSVDWQSRTGIEAALYKSIQTMEDILGKPLAQLPRFPLVIDSWEALVKLNNPGYMNTIKDPISLGFCADGWPFVVIKVFDAETSFISRSIYLYTGPQGNCWSDWNGWHEAHNGSSCPSFIHNRHFIQPDGNLIPGLGVPTEVQNLKDFIKEGEGKDGHGKRWKLATT